MPHDLFPYLTKPSGLIRIDHLDEPNPALQVFPEMGMGLAILTLRPKANAVRESRLEAIKIGPFDVDALIHYEAGQLLPHTTTHDSCFMMIRRKTLLMQNGGNMRCEPVNAPFKLLVARKCEIVCVPRVLSAGRSR